MVLRWTKIVWILIFWQLMVDNHISLFEFFNKHFVLNKFLFFKQEYYGVSYNFSANPAESQDLGVPQSIFEEK